MLCALWAAQGPENHGILFLSFSQCSPFQHQDARKEDATQITYDGNESLTKEGEKGEARTAGQD